MIPLPDGLTLKRNKGDEAKLVAAARKWMEREERAPGLHASGFLDLRYTYWSMVDPLPISDRVIPIFLIGKVLHSFVLGGLGGEAIDLNITDEGSSYNEELGFWYSPDWDRAGEIAEFKTSRAFKAPVYVEDVDTYLEQVLVYMVSKKVLSAKLWVLYLNLRDESRRTSPEFRAYTITVTQEELDAVRDYLIESKRQLELAVAQKDYTGLPLCRDFKCGAGRCDWWDKCRPEGRYGIARWGPTSNPMPIPSEVQGVADTASSAPARSRRKRKSVGADVRGGQSSLLVPEALRLDEEPGPEGTPIDEGGEA